MEKRSQRIERTITPRLAYQGMQETRAGEDGTACSAAREEGSLRSWGRNGGWSSASVGEGRRAEYIRGLEESRVPPAR